MFSAGAGQVGDYQACAWQVLGQGQFIPGVGADPYLGENAKLTYVEEYRVEMVCKSKVIKNVLVAMKKAHPYEEVAYDVISLVDVLDILS